MASKPSWCSPLAAGALVALAPCALVAQDVARSSTDCTDDAGAAVYGIVRSADSVGVLAHAYVTIETGLAEADVRLLADHRGVFLRCGLPARETRLTGHLSGYSSPPVGAALTEGGVHRIDLVIDFEGAPAAAGSANRAVSPGRLVGSLSDRDGEEISGGALELVSTPWQSLSDSRGRFEFGEVLPGPHVLRIEHLGFGTIYWPVEIPPGETVELHASLAPVALRLEPIVVAVHRMGHLDRNGFYDRRDWGARTGLGFFLTREDIEAWAPSRISTALTRAPRIDVACTGGFRGCRPRVMGSRCEQMVMYLDGVKFTLASDPIDDFVTPNDIAAIEVYTGIGDLAPDFADTESQRCGAVAIWTRR